MRTYASAEERAAKNQKTTVRHFGFTEKVYGLPCTVRTILLWKRHHRNAIVRLSFFFYPGAIAVEARRRRATSARYIIFIRAVQVFTTCTRLSLVAVVMLLVVILACEQS